MTNGWSAFLVDSNVLVYAFDPRDQRKRRQAVVVLERLVSSGRGVLSVQCLSEFFNVVTRRLPEPIPARMALLELERFARLWRILELTPVVVLEGCRIASAHSVSVSDSLIWATAKLNQVPYVLTEDVQHGPFLEGVSFENPFAAEFDPALLD